MKHHIKIAATIIVLTLMYHTIDRDVFWQSIRFADVRWLFIAILLFFPCQVLLAYRWYFILSKLNRTMPFRTILHHSVLGQFSVLVLPGQVSGDIVKLLSASRGQEQKVPIVLSVVIDKLALLLAVSTLALVGVFAPGPVSYMTAVHLAALITIVLALLALLVLCQYRSNNSGSVLINCVLRSRFIQSYLKVGDFLTLPRVSDTAVFNIIISALALLCFYTVGAYFVALSMHIEINPLDWIAINAIVSVVQILPVTVGGLGVREGAFGFILSLYGVPFSQAIVFSLTGFALGAILTSLLWVVLNSIEFKR